MHADSEILRPVNVHGHGEVDPTALECSYKGIEIEPVVRKDLYIEWPRAETAENWAFMGFDEDLNQAMRIAVNETVKWQTEQKIVPMNRRRLRPNIHRR